MSEADLIHRAALRLREVAASATPGPWQVDGPWWHDRPGQDDPDCTGLVTAGEGRAPVLLGVPIRETASDEANLRCAATMDPIVVAAVADMLDAALPYTRLREWSSYPYAVTALAVAQAVLADA